MWYRPDFGYVCGACFLEYAPPRASREDRRFRLPDYGLDLAPITGPARDE